MKKIKDFQKKCMDINIPIKEIKAVQKSLSLKKGKLYLIGGAVRNLILNKSFINQYPDLVTDLSLDDLTKCLKKSNIKFLPIGVKYGSLVVLVNKIKIDVTIMREDIKTDGRWAKIKHTKDIELDSKRRDFTINSIYCDIKGNLYDPNNGYIDLKNGVIKFIGKIENRVSEDYLRVLRFVRFSIIYDKNLDIDTLNKLVKYEKNIADLSSERRFEELQKIIIHKNFSKNINLKSIRKIIQSSVGEKLNFKNVERLCEIERKLKNISFLRRLKFLLRDVKKSLNFEKKMNKELIKRLKYKIGITRYSKICLRKIFYKHDDIYIKDKLLENYANKKISLDTLSKVLKNLDSYKKKKLPINGADIIKLGFSAGSDVGEVIKKTEDWWIKNNFRKNKKECIEFVSRYLP